MTLQTRELTIKCYEASGRYLHAEFKDFGDGLPTVEVLARFPSPWPAKLVGMPHKVAGMLRELAREALELASWLEKNGGQEKKPTLMTDGGCECDCMICANCPYYDGGCAAPDDMPCWVRDQGCLACEYYSDCQEWRESLMCDGGVSITEWFRKKHGREPGEGFGRIVILKEGEELVITFESDEVREIQTKSGKMPVVDGRDEAGEKVSLCISHVALADRLAWLAKKNGGLRGLKVRIKNLGRGNRSYRYSIEVLGQRTLDVAREG